MDPADGCTIRTGWAVDTASRLAHALRRGKWRIQPRHHKPPNRGHQRKPDQSSGGQEVLGARKLLLHESHMYGLHDSPRRQRVGKRRTANQLGVRLGRSDALVALLKNEMDVGQVARASARAEESHSRALQRLVGDELLLTRASGKKIEVAVRHAITHPGATHVDFCRAMRLCQIKQIWQQVQQLLDLEQACAADCQQATKNLEIEIKKAYAKAEIEHLAQESRLGRHTDAGISVAECIKTQSICDCLNAIEKVHCG